MKTISTFAILMGLVLLFMAPVSAQTKVKENTKVAKEIKFETKTHDYGKVEEGQYPGYRFIFVNNSDKTLKVAGFTRACNFTVPSYTQEEIKPGESGYLIVVLNPRDLKGSIRKNMQVIFLYSDNNEQTLTGKNILLEGNIISDSI